MNDELSPEDELRLNVLFNTELKAVRIDESNMTLWALTPQGEASVPLKPNERADRYLKRVREMLSGHALGSPGGYPVHLMRDAVCRGSMGRTLAQFLVDHLAFLHEDDVGILDTVAVMLVSGVLTDAERLAIWKRGNSRNSYYVAFLELQPDNLPSPRAARADPSGGPHPAGHPYRH